MTRHCSKLHTSWSAGQDERSQAICREEIWEGAVHRLRMFEDRRYCLADNINESIDPVIINLNSDEEEDLCVSYDEN